MSKIIGKEKLEGCVPQIHKLSERLAEYAEECGTVLIVTSGKRSGTGRSWHNSGKAMDFCFKDSNVFKHTTVLYTLCAEQIGAYKGVTEFEVCRRNRDNKQHFHIAFGEEGCVESWTGVYS